MIMWSVRDSNSGSITFSRHWIERFDAVTEPAHLELRRRRQQVDGAVRVQVAGCAAASPPSPPMRTDTDR